MLDDLDYIARFDSDNALAVAAGQPEQLTYETTITIPKGAKPHNIVIAGMGGSGLAGLVCKNWWGKQLQQPLELIRDYNLPAYVNADSLVIISSYSGNTEEALAILKEARSKQAPLIIITSGGKLQELAQKDGHPLILLPGGYQPRMAVWFEIKILSVIFERLGLVKDVVKELEETAIKLNDMALEYVSSVPTQENLAKQVAEQIMGKAIWVYSGPALSSIAYKWKIDFNENAKNVASWNEFPEFNHNEFLGWTSHPVEKPFAIIQLQCSLDHPQIKKRFAATNRLLSGKIPKPISVNVEGDSHIEQLLSAMLLGDFASIYLAILNGVNPTRVDLVEKLKQEL